MTSIRASAASSAGILPASARRLRRFAAVGMTLLTLTGLHQHASACSDCPDFLAGRTNKNTIGENTGVGCAGGGCHAQDTGMAVTLSGPATLGIYSRGAYTVTATRTGLGPNGGNSGVKMGMAVAASDGPPTPLAESSLNLVLSSSGEVIHSAAGGGLNATNASGSASYTFYYTMPLAAALGSVHTLYAVARLGGSSNGGAGGGWKHALNLSVTATTGPPSPPTIGTATAGNAQASVSFTAPVSDGGSPIISYTAIAEPGGLTGTGTALPIVVGGLTNGTTYTFRVKAANAVASGDYSAPSNAVTPGAPPGPPTNVSATRGNAEATVMFSPPASSGTGSISSYEVTSTPGGFTAMGSGSPLVVTGLSNGVAYTFTVTATSAFGPGIASSPSNSVTPEPIAGPPTAVQATPGNMQATVTFNLPASSGGSPISGFTVTSSPSGGTDSNAGTTGLSHIVTGLTNGIAYTFTVTATNASGAGVVSQPSFPVTPRTIPGAPTGVTATPAGGAASVAFLPPVDNGGSAVTGYLVTSTPPGGQDANAGSTGLTHTITNLANGTSYAFTVVATNVAGNGPPSLASNSVVPRTGVSPNVLWTRELRGEANCGPSFLTSGPAIDESGNIFVTGCALAGAGPGLRTHKIDGATGAVLWSTSYTNFPKPDQFPLAHGLVVDVAGNVLLTATLRDSGYNDSVRAIKYNGATGAELWNVGYSAATADETNNDIGVDRFGDVFVTGYGTSGMRTIKYDGANGLEKWVAKDLRYAFALAVAATGDVVVTGSYDGAGGRNFRTIKYSSASGIELWNASYSSSSPNGVDTGRAVALGTGGAVFVTGDTEGTSQTIKYNGVTGAEIWSVPSNLPSGRWAAIAVDSSGNPAVVGSDKDALGEYNIRTVKYNGANGAELWRSAYGGSANSADFGASIAVDADGNVIVTGTSRDTVGGPNIRTIKYNGTTGAEVWNHVYTSAFYDEARQVSVGPDNAIYVVGGLDRFSSEDIVLVQKLAAFGAPGAPIILNATAGNGQFSLNFSPPDSDGGAAITLYEAACTASGQPTRTNSAVASPIVVTGATAGVSYACTITASNSAGTGSPSFSVTASALPPPAPTVTAIVPPDGPNTGGTDATIAGTGFVTGASVTLGGVAATNVSVIDATTITATTSAHPVGLVNVVVTNPDTQLGTLASGFAYLSARVLDVDVNGSYHAPTDGLLVMRYLFGLTGTALTAGALGGGAALTDPAQLVDYLNYLRPKFDVDGNGKADALTDGLMLIRYLSGLRGPMLTTGAIGAGATRTPEEIETYIQTLMPTSNPLADFNAP